MDHNSDFFGTLTSGSKGNCAVFRLGGRTLLVDAGRSAKYITDNLKALGHGIENAEGIFVTHSHSDHTDALRVLTRRYGVRIHAPAPIGEEIGDLCAEGTLIRHPMLFTQTFGDVAVSSFATSHDTDCSVGYVFERGERKFGYATDLGCVTAEVTGALTGCLGVILEANHDVDMLTCGPYSPDLKRRILSRRGHLSNDDAAALAVRLAQSGTRCFLLGHLSEENNDPALALRTVRRALDAAGFSGVRVTTASQYAPVILSADTASVPAG